MNFTKENVEYYWKVLNTVSSPEEKKTADEFLIEFKKAPQALDICVQLFDSTEVGSHFLSAIVLHQILKTRINEVIEKKEEFLKFRDIILNNLLVKMKSSPGYIIERICFSISILMAVGIITYWPECIEEIINFAKSSKENCYLALTILENINKELFELNISNKTLLRIKDMLIDRKQFIQEFIFLVLTNVCGQNSPENEIKVNNQIFNKTLLLTHSWIKLGLNVLKIPLLSQTLITYLNADNIKNIAEIFSDSIQFSTNSKYYSSNEVYDIDVIMQHCDKEELQSIENLVGMIKNSLINISTKNLDLDEIEILSGLANIFSSILENFIYLLFARNQMSQTILEIFFFFISHKNKKISLKFFETMNEMREFINRGYKFYNYTDEEKIQFANFLFKISESVMLNCKLNNLRINSSLIQKKETFTVEELESLHETEQNFDEDLEEIGVSVSEYRKSAEDVWYNIFLIFTYNFGEEGAQFFFKWVINMLTGLDISNDSIAHDEGRLLVVEVLIKVVKSVLDSIDINQMNHSLVLDFCSLILNSKILLNDCMIMKFLQFLDEAAPFIGKEKNMLTSIVGFLTNVAKIKFLEDISTYILLEVSDFLTKPDIENFRTVFEFYRTNYDNFAYASLSHVCDTLTNLVGVLDKESKSPVGLSEEEIVNYFSFILQPATERIHKTFQFLQNQTGLSESDYSKIKMEFLKNYTIHNSILKKSYFLTEKILFGSFDIHMKDTFEITQNIIKVFVKDSHMIREISKLFIKPLHHLSSKIANYFEEFNEMMVNAYINNYENFSCLSLLKVLYSETVKNSPDKKDSIGRSFLNLCDVINKNVLIMKKNQIELVDVYSQLFIRVIDSLDYMTINQEFLNNTIILFLDVLKTVAEPSMNKNVIRVFTRILTNLNIIPKEYTYNLFADITYTVFYSCDHFEPSALPDFTSFTLAAVNYDTNVFSSTLFNLLTLPKFKALKKEHVEVIVRYLTSRIGKEEKNTKLILSDIVNITKGMGQTESLMQFAMALAHEDRKQKLANV